MMPERIAELRRLCDAATPGPWRGDRLDGTVKYDIIGANHEVVVHGDNGNASDADYNYGTTNENDERFIITSRTAVPELLDENDALRAELARLKKEDRIRELTGRPCMCSGWSTNNGSGSRTCARCDELARLKGEEK